MPASNQFQSHLLQILSAGPVLIKIKSHKKNNDKKLLIVARHVHS